MKKRIIFIFCFLILFILLAFISVKIENMINVPNVKIEEKIRYKVSNITEENEKFSIKVYYPVTEYDDLNFDINSLVNSYLESFKNQIPYLSSDKKYYLNITFETYLKENYISYLFLIKENLGCLHDEKYVVSINYDTKKDKILTISDLVQKDENLLNKLSTISFNAIKENKDIDSVKNEEFIKEGIIPIYKNFETFVINKNSLDIYFNEYQILPYYYGVVKVEIPYDELGINF